MQVYSAGFVHLQLSGIYIFLHENTCYKKIMHTPQYNLQITKAKYIQIFAFDQKVCLTDKKDRRHILSLSGMYYQNMLNNMFETFHERTV